MSSPEASPQDARAPLAPSSAEKRRESLASYHITDLAFDRESPDFRAAFDWHRQELTVADEHLRSLTGCAAALVTALQTLGSASANLATCLERTPGVFQAAQVTGQLSGVLQDLASAGDVLAESLDLSLARPLEGLRDDVARVDDVKRARPRRGSSRGPRRGDAAAAGIVPSRLCCGDAAAARSSETSLVRRGDAAVAGCSSETSLVGVSRWGLCRGDATGIVRDVAVAAAR